jgi:putative DNA primase/helicase
MLRAGLGIFEALHGFVSAEAFARLLKAASATTHGAPARTFLRHIVDDLENVRKTVAEHTRKFQTDLVDESADGQVIRAAQRFALIGMGGEIAVGGGILPWKPGTAMQASKRCLRLARGARRTRAPRSGGIERSGLRCSH